MIEPRSTKYRRLALVEPDPEKAELLFQIANEADRGVLFTSERLYDRPSTVSETGGEAKDNLPS
jgi:hypothetical protein